MRLALEQQAREDAAADVRMLRVVAAAVSGMLSKEGAKHMKDFEQALLKLVHGEDDRPTVKRLRAIGRKVAEAIGK